MDSYVFCRPNHEAIDLPIGSFRWKHASGAEIIARRSDDHYLTQGYLLQNLQDGKWEEHHRDEGDFLFLWGWETMVGARAMRSTRICRSSRAYFLIWTLSRRRPSSFSHIP